MKKPIYVQGLIMLLLLLICSCTPEFKSTFEELDLAITTYDDTQDFSQISSFYMKDTIIYITDDEVEIRREETTTEKHILDEVRQNLLEIGWTEISDTANEEISSDVAIMISVLETDIYYYYTYWWDYWYWYPWDWWYPGYPGYPGYPSYPSYPHYSYTVGSLIVDMVKMKDVVLPPVEDGQSPRFPIIWSGVVNGILSGSEENIQGRLTRQIRQVFIQSDYLHKATTDR